MTMNWGKRTKQSLKNLIIPKDAFLPLFLTHSQDGASKGPCLRQMLIWVLSKSNIQESINDDLPQFEVFFQNDALEEGICTYDVTLARRQITCQAKLNNLSLASTLVDQCSFFVTVIFMNMHGALLCFFSVRFISIMILVALIQFYIYVENRLTPTFKPHVQACLA